MSQQFAVIGLGRFGMSVARTLAADGAEVLAVDRELNLVEEIADEVAHAVSFDATQKANLESHALGDMDGIIVGIGENFEATILVTALAKELGVPIIVARSYNLLQKRILQMVGATQVVNPEEDGGRRVAQALVERDVVELLTLPEGFELREVAIDDRFAAKPLSELITSCGERVAAVQLSRDVGGDDPESAHSEQFALPLEDTRLLAGDRLSLIGPSRALDRL